MIVDPLPIFKHYLNGKPLTTAQTDILLFALYMENFKLKGELTLAALQGKNVLTRCVCGRELEMEVTHS